MENSLKKALSLIALLSLFTSAHAHAEFLPKSKAHLFDTMGYYSGTHTGVLVRNGGRAWGALGLELAVYEFDGVEAKPQVTAFSSVHAGYRWNDRGNGVFTETFDARVGFTFQHQFKPGWRYLVGIMHQSGHAADEIQDREMFGTNLGEEVLLARIIHDWSDKIRAGATFKPFLTSDPKMQFPAADQFVEWMPWGSKEKERKATPYIALSFDEQGTPNRYFFTVHTQLGLYWGAHMDEEHRPLFRVVTGYYQGMDPRLKYAQFRNRFARFGYMGIMFSI